jgi:hypothetical protein
MGKREGSVENYLREQVAACFGLCEKHVSPGLNKVPDDLVTWFREMDLVETKAPGKGADDGQIRDHKRRARLGVPVYLLDTKEKVDMYVRLRSRGHPCRCLHSVPVL